MSDAAEDKLLGHLLVLTHKLSPHELQSCLEEQRQRGGGADQKSLAEILTERGLLSSAEIEETSAIIPSLRPLPEDTLESPQDSEACSEDLPAEVRSAVEDPRRRIGRYAALSELGRGGMGIVYHCYDPQLHRNVAIKMILDATNSEADNLARFKQEARACAKLRHPGIVSVHEVGDHKGCPFMVMDFVQGETLEDLLESQQLPTRRIVEIFRDVAMALEHAHSRGIIHRDVKPSNILLDSTGTPLLLDFGVAHDSSARNRITKTGQLIGTPLFMAPEQINGTSTGPYSDVYALGATLYCALTRQAPFPETHPAVLLKKILFDEPESLRHIDPSIHRDLETITLKCLEKAPYRRYSSAAAVAQDLRRFLAGEPIMARPIGRGERAARWLQRNRALSAAMIVTALTMVGATAVVMVQATKARREREALRLEAERQSTRREDRARLQAERAAEARSEQAVEEAARQERTRLASEALAQLRQDVTAVLDRVQSGEHLENPNDRQIQRNILLGHRDLETVRLLTEDLDALSQHLARNLGLPAGQASFLHFLCDTLADLGFQQGAVASLGRYLKAELALPAEVRDQLRAVPAGRALCLLGGEEADRLLQETRAGFGLNNPFWLQVGRLYHRTGVKPALEEETAEGYRQRGLLRLEKGDLEGAIADYTRAIEADPGDSLAWGNRGTAHARKGDYAEAIADFSRAISLKPGSAITWSSRGAAHASNGNHAGAISDFTRAIVIDAGNATAWYGRGAARAKEGNLEGAMADFSRAIELEPDHSESWYHRARLRHDHDDIPGAIADYSKVIEIAPSNVLAWINRGTAHADEGNHADAIADFSQAIELEPKDARTWTNRGTSRTWCNDIAGAMADHTRAIEIDPSDAGAWFHRGSTRVKGGDLDGAMKDYSRAIVIEPSDANAWHARASLRHDRGDIEGAIADYSKVIVIEPGSAPSWVKRGLTRYTMKDFEGALADFTRATEIEPEYSNAWSNRGIARKALGDIDGAIADYNRAIEVDPLAVNPWFNRGNARRALRSYQEAIADYTRVIEIDPTHVNAWGSRGLTRKDMGDLEEAIADLEQCLKLAPDHPWVPELRADLVKLRLQQAGAGR